METDINGTEQEIVINDAVADIAGSLGLNLEEQEERAEQTESSDTVQPETKEEPPKPEEQQEKKTEEEKSEQAAPIKSRAPKTWRPDAAKEWEVLPLTVREEILKREEDMFKGIERYKETAQFGEQLNNKLSPYRESLRTRGLEPTQHIQHLLHADHVLTYGNLENKLKVFKMLGDSVGIPATAWADADQAPYEDPSVSALKKQIDTINSQLQNERQERATAQRAKLAETVQSFAADPANIYFEEVAHILPGLITSGQAKTLQDAYEQAIWLHPETRAKEVARQTATQQSKQQEEDAKRIADAKKAANVVVKKSPKTGRGTAAVGTIDDTLLETLKEIQQRG